MDLEDIGADDEAQTLLEKGHGKAVREGSGAMEGGGKEPSEGEGDSGVDSGPDEGLPGHRSASTSMRKSIEGEHGLSALAVEAAGAFRMGGGRQARLPEISGSDLHEQGGAVDTNSVVIAGINPGLSHRQKTDLITSDLDQSSPADAPTSILVTRASEPSTI